MKTKQRTTFVGQITLDAALADPAPLDWTPPKRGGTVVMIPIVCAVCDHDARISVLADGRLCDACRADLDRAAGYVEGKLNQAETAAGSAFDRQANAITQASEQDQARYDRVLDARKTLDAATYRAKWAKALAKDDGLSVILRADEALAAAQYELDKVRAWATRARAEIEAAKDAR